MLLRKNLKKKLKETMDVDIATFGTLDGKHDADNWFVNKDSFIPQEAF